MNIDVNKLKELIGEENVRDNIADLYVYGSDSSVHQANPSVVVRPKAIEEVQHIMRYADTELIPVIARGAGSGMSGQAVQKACLEGFPSPHTSPTARSDSES